MKKQNNPTVLIVDDEPFGRDSLEMLLLNQGYNLAFAADGAEALAKAAELIPDLILLDVMMPDMDGFEVCRRLRSDVVLADVPVVLVTALDDRDSRLQGIEAGADDFVTKPFDRAELRTRVNTITRLNRFRRLMAERTKFEWVVEQADDGYLITDDSGCISYANTKARLYLELSLDANEPVTETFHQLIRKQYHAQPETAWAIWPDSDQATPHYLVRPETASSKPFWLQVEALQLDLSTDSPWVVHLRDVTAQMELKSDKWQFHAMISHKFRTPLIPLVTGMDLLRNQAADLSTEDIVGLADKAVHGINRLQRTIEDILQYLNVPRRPGTDNEFVLTNFESLVQQIAYDLELGDVIVLWPNGLQSQRAKLQFPPDATELILREVLENSKKFHPEQAPQITITVEESRFSPFIIIRVTDNGITLSSEQLAQVWTPYYQGEKFFTGETSGMGLGLPMVASAVWNAGGKCRLYNRRSESGIVVEFSLPFETVCEESYAVV
jgi:DNA-binding response OmpR family regulator